ncbi:LOW QUALITY PROTEIN: RNA polymerase, beta subunit, protrusion [Dillenia turbinata]|uniref:DNA-directed RNA polymerase n=1 Tax=Dillenia turbinata TaxID=194707 RepID=A0AAN8WCD6_9MAGN
MLDFVRGLVKQHLDSFNYFVNTGIKKIVKANDRITSTIHPNIFLRYKDVKIGEPSVVVDTVSERLTPHMCRLSDMTYSAPIEFSIEYTVGPIDQPRLVQKDNVVIGRMPIMLRSCCCVLYHKDEAELARLGECPLDPGGYFVVKGTEKKRNISCFNQREREDYNSLISKSEVLNEIMVLRDE